jgi:hypothetical protein
MKAFLISQNLMACQLIYVCIFYAGCVALQRSHQQGGRVSRVVRSPDERGQRRRPGMALQREDNCSDQESGSFSF